MEKRYTKLSDIVEIISGGTPKTSIPEYWDGAIPWLSVNDFSGDSRWVDSAEKSVTELGVQKSATKILNKGDLIISARGTVGELAELLKPMAFNQSCFGLRGKNNTDTAYLYYLLKFNMPKIKVVANGATFGTIVLDTFDRIKLESYNDISLQKKIANILSRYDEAIENNNKRIKLLEQMAQNLYKEWFVRFRFPGWQNVEFENGIPKGWRIEKLGNLANISTGKCNREDAEDDGVYPLFDRSQEIKLSNDWIKDCEAIIVPGEGTSFIPRYYVGKFNLHQRCYCVEPKYEKTGKFLFYTLMMNRRYFLSVATGATVPSLRYNNFSMMKFIMPEIKICQKYDEFVTNCFNQINILKAQNQNLTKQRDLLLPRLMSGKLEVK